MELRAYLLILALAIAVIDATAASVKRYPLDDRTSYAVRIGTEAPTTVVFPDKIAALDGMNLSAKPDEAPPVLLSQQPGANYFSVRALRPDAAAAVNVILHGKVIALTFATGAEPDRTVTFTEEPPAAATRTNQGPTRLLGLLDQAGHYPQLVEQYPALASRIDHQVLAGEATGGTVSTRLVEVFRFETEAALVFRAQIENRGPNLLRYDATRLGVRVGQQIYSATLTDATGELPAHTVAEVWLVLTGETAGLSLKNQFSLALPQRQ